MSENFPWSSSIYQTSICESSVMSETTRDLLRLYKGNATALRRDPKRCGPHKPASESASKHGKRHKHLKFATAVCIWIFAWIPVQQPLAETRWCQTGNDEEEQRQVCEGLRWSHLANTGWSRDPVIYNHLFHHLGSLWSYRDSQGSKQGMHPVTWPNRSCPGTPGHLPSPGP